MDFYIIENAIWDNKKTRQNTMKKLLTLMIGLSLLSVAQQVAIIKGGKLIRSGTMEEVKGDDSLEDVFLELEK